ncbi:3-deoxy-D-arabino-heptulosonate 7-phosphate synthase [Achromobacter aloeverae]|uniref:3-deoxy-D-arabino-heptulosonate 7-phosphate synthase n=1 Tax=Achromobacter aloeverae TaxID=1750518 RepID=A0A4Q1HLB3_9BURK|nr:3-deoxy-D-arabino-heptulosonate 7-phosphate synthase [Achromobacter aloeverae]RXN91227.1 3-deoxy-D-arabino-heptulosonate 7-phosphate synthase [Achromobacter aloeverae]
MPQNTPTPGPATLEGLPHAVARRYRIPAVPAAAHRRDHPPALELALVIEQARAALVAGRPLRAGRKEAFIDALARLVQDAMRPARGDFAFQAMVLRHRKPRVREHASLSAHADQDRRALLSAVNAIAHPGKRERLPPGPLRDGLSRLQDQAAAAAWPALADTARQVLSLPEAANNALVERGLRKLLDAPALDRLRRLADLADDDSVREYEALWDRRGPRSGSAQAAALGRGTQQRGAAVEALAAQALQAWARRLSVAAGDPAAYRVVTSMRVPAAIAGKAERAKTEWDVALLRRAPGKDDGQPDREPMNDERAGVASPDARPSRWGPADGDGAPVWDVCLLAEAKSSVDAATTDYPRLLRGLRLLARADAGARYPFSCREGVVMLRGAALQALPTDGACLDGTVLYCCDAPADDAPRLLNAASRMQLLSAPASLAYATRLAEDTPADPALLEAVWDHLVSSPQWQSVLEQYATLHRVRDLMVHVADLAAATRAP